MNIQEARAVVTAIVKQNLALPAGSADAAYINPMLWSVPGLGKTSIVRQVAADLGIECIDVVFAQFDSGELAGFPMLNTEEKTYERARPFFLPTEGKGIIFLDELPQAPVSNQNIAAQLNNERRIGEHYLPEGWTVVNAGNPMSARAGTVNMPAHLKDRLLHIDVDADHEMFLDYALTKKLDARITGFIRFRPEFLSKPDPQVNASPSPRSWERANSILSLGLESHLEMAALTGQVGEACVADFWTFCKIYMDLPDPVKMLKDPENSTIPTDPSIMYALCSALSHHVTKETAANFVVLLDKFPNKEFSAFAIRDALKIDPSLMKDKAIQKWFLSSGKELLL